ncbi:hypothetical protein LC1981_0252 [Lacticaseibacillus paracasei NRIC 1981]|uniref:hypothetical protein n=1 Tax=Lacticaseibacillus paracasei TaxID=1597 RepID=UPI0005E08389|nr:hypothetical protein [Lacticaseibacillus paracasei]NLM26530.1 hypothetical protein [Bacillota bacterium]GAN41033.1 hypothetical protein LC1981_0252 [Lacticaseibacillus paracasei NRIC 1981]
MFKISLRGESADLFMRIMALNSKIDKINGKMLARDVHNQQFGTVDTDGVITYLENEWDSLMNERNKLVNKLSHELG